MEEEASVCTTVGLARSWKKEEREKEEASHAHVITNAAGIHDPTSPRPSTSKCHDVAPFLPLASPPPLFPRLFPQHPPFPGMYNVHVLNGGPTTKQEERERNILKLGFYTFTVSRNRFRGTCTQSNLMRVREGTNEKPRLGYVQTLVCCLILLKPWNRFDAGKNQLVDFWSVSLGDSVTLIY